MTDNTRVLANGAVYDMTTKRIVSGSGITTKITSANAREMQSLAIAKKRETVRAAANAAVQRGDLATQHGDMAYVAEIAQAQMVLATTPDAGKASTLAAEWLVTNSGLGEKQVQAQVGGQVGGQVGDRIQAIVMLLLADADAPTVIEGAVTDAESEAEGDGE